MFDGSLVEVGSGAPGGVVALPELGPVGGVGSVVDVVVGRLVGALLAEVGQPFGLAVVSVSCTAAPMNSVDFANVFDGRDPGVDLVEILEGLEPGDLHDAALVEAIAAWERVTSLAAARQGLIAELFRRREAMRMGKFVGDEVAARLAMTRTVAEAKVGLAVCLDLMPAVHDALVSGVIDVRKATALTEGLAHQPLATALAVQGEVLPDAPDLTVPQLRARIRRVELALDPDADLDDPRPIGARRADALTDILAGVLDTDVGLTGPLGARHRRRRDLGGGSSPTPPPGSSPGSDPAPTAPART